MIYLKSFLLCFLFYSSLFAADGIIEDQVLIEFDNLNNRNIISGMQSDGALIIGSNKYSSSGQSHFKRVLSNGNIDPGFLIETNFNSAGGGNASEILVLPNDNFIIARNDMGEGISAGMYIYTIQAGDFRATKKMVLLK